jgi:uncharacterized membrane protein
MADGFRSLVFVWLLLLQGFVFAHGTESHEDKPQHVEQQRPVEKIPDAALRGGGAAAPAAQAGSTEPGAADGDSEVIGSKMSVGGIIDDLAWSQFPTLHPMIVHLPVTLIPLAFVFSVISLFVPQRVFIWLALAFAAAGLAGGFVAAFPMHPHTTGLSEAAKFTLEKHDFFAYATLWLTLVAVFVALFCLWKPNRLDKAGLSLILLLSSVSVAITGHYGGTLAYVHGVGVQGQFLSSH